MKRACRRIERRWPRPAGAAAPSRGGRTRAPSHRPRGAARGRADPPSHHSGAASSRLGRAVVDDQAAVARSGLNRPVEEREQVAARPVHVLDQPDCGPIRERVERGDPGVEPCVPFRAEVGRRMPRRTGTSTRRTTSRTTTSARDGATAASASAASSWPWRPVDTYRAARWSRTARSPGRRTRPRKTVSAGAATRRPNSARSRLLPTPGGATISSRCAVAPSRTRPSASLEAAELRRRGRASAHAGRPSASSRDGCGRGPTASRATHRLGLALQLDGGTDRVSIRPRATARAVSSPSSTPPGVRRRLQARGGVHGVAGHPARIGSAGGVRRPRRC